MSKQNEWTRKVFEMGYNVNNNIIYSKNGNIIKGSINSNGYKKFNTRIDGETVTIMVHRLVGYQKFGDRIFENDIQVRHLNGDPLCNFEWNIEIGSQSDNMMDKTKESRIKSALIATSHVKIHEHMDILEARKKGMSYSELCKKFNIKSKGTISWILRKSMDSKKCR